MSGLWNWLWAGLLGALVFIAFMTLLGCAIAPRTIYRRGASISSPTKDGRAYTRQYWLEETTEKPDNWEGPLLGR